MGSYIVHKAVELSNMSDRAVAALNDDHWIVSPKYDGCHAIFCFDNGKHLATYSRTGEVVLSMDHIAADLLAMYPLASAVSGRVAICGEAWKCGEEFNVISGKFRRQYPQPDLEFVPFDIVPFDYNDTTFDGPPVLLGQLNGKQYPAPYRSRLLSLNSLRTNQLPSRVIMPRYISLPATSFTEAYEIAVRYAKEHKERSDSFFDGAVLAKANGLYLVGAGKGGEFIKCKPLISYSVKVTAVVSDIGVKTGKNTCVLMFDLDGMIQKVSTGLTQQQADEFTEYPGRIIDCIIEVEAMGKTVNGYLREPRFKGIRTDV